MRLRWRGRLAAVVGLALVLSGCAGTGDGQQLTPQATGTPIRGEVDPNATLRVGYGVAPTSLDPHAATSEVVSFRFGLSLVYDRLFTITSEGVVTGMLVNSWEYSEDGRTLTMRLREDVTFRDGTPLDAEAVRVNLERVRSMSTAPGTRLRPVTSVQVTGPYEVRLTLASPTQAIPYVLADVAGFILHPDLITNGDPATTANGSGAYRVESFTPGESLTLVRDRDDYWDPEAAKIRCFEFTAITDQQAYTNAIVAGQIDIGQYQPQNIAAVKGKEGLVTVPVPQGIGVELFLNHKVPPLDQVKVRQAINHAYDRAAIAQVLYPGSEPKWQYTRKGMPGFDEKLEGAYPYDPERAKQLLAEAGFPNGVHIGQVLVTTAVGSQLPDVLREQLGQVGITFEPVTVDQLQIFQQWGSGAAAGMLNFTPAIGEPVSTAVSRWEARQPPGLADDPEYARLKAAASAPGLSDEDRRAAAAKLNGYTVEQAWGAPIVWINYPWVMTDRLQGFTTGMDYATTSGPYDFRYLSMVKKD